MPKPPTPPQQPPAEAPSSPQEPQQQAPEPSHVERQYRAVSVELEALRRRLEDVPDPEALAAIQEKARRFDELSQQLPQWQQQLQASFEAEQLALRQRAEQREAELASARFEAAAAAAFSKADGRSELWAEFHRIVSDRLERDDDGEILLDGQPFGERFEQLAADPGNIMSSFRRPRFGSGSGGRSSRDGRTMPGRGLSLKDGKSRLFQAAFGGR